MISSTVIVACRGAKRWFDLDAVRTEAAPATMAAQRQVMHTPAGVDGSQRDSLGAYTKEMMAAGAPPLDWHLDGLTSSPDFQPREGTMSLRYIVGDTRDVTATIPDGSVDLIFTSPPFLALRSYLPADHPDKHREIGSEANPATFLDTLLELTAEWGRVLAPRGTLAVELGDTYSGHDYGTGGDQEGRSNLKFKTEDGTRLSGPFRPHPSPKNRDWPLAKSLAMIPQLYGIALAYGINPLTGQPSPAGRWRVRNVIAWHRPNPPVGALGDKWRPASSTITVACRGQKRWFDLDAVRTDYQGHARTAEGVDRQANTTKQSPDGNRQTLDTIADVGAGAPPLDWHQDGDLGTGHIILTTQPYAGSHYATFPMELPRKIIDCMCPRQVCRVCGKARERITDVSFTPLENPEQNNAEPKASADYLGQQRQENAQGMANGRATKNVNTLGWSDCGHDNYRPGLVFDPFVGTGSVLAAAQDLGRDAIGVDLDPRNAWLARDRVGMFLTIEGDEHSTPTIETVDAGVLGAGEDAQVLDPVVE